MVIQGPNYLKLKAPRLYTGCNQASVAFHSTVRKTRNLYGCSRSNFDDGTMISLPSPDKIVHSAQQRNTTSYQYRPIHSSRRDFLKAGPEAEKEHKCKVGTSKRVVCNSKRTRQLPGTPCCTRHAVVGDRNCPVVESCVAREYCTSATTVQK